MCLSWKMWLLLGWDLKKLIGISHLWNLKREKQLRYQSWLGSLLREYPERQVCAGQCFPCFDSSSDSISTPQTGFLELKEMRYSPLSPVSFHSELVYPLSVPSHTKKLNKFFSFSKWTRRAFKWFYPLLSSQGKLGTQFLQDKLKIRWYYKRGLFYKAQDWEKLLIFWTSVSIEVPDLLVGNSL